QLAAPLTPGKLPGGTGTYRTDLHMADVNRDGNPDVVLDEVSQKYSVLQIFQNVFYQYTSYSNVWLGRGDGTFGPVTTTISTRTFSAPVPGDFIPVSAFADVNHDGIADRIGLNMTAGAIDVELGNSDGTYQPTRGFAAGPSPGTIAVGDFNGDGWADVAVVNN